jgi:hypothetical protein
VALVRRKVWKGADENDHSQTHVIALQIRKVVDKYLSKNPKLARDWSIQNSHIHIASAIVVEAVYEIQMHREKIFSKYLLNDDVEKVDVDSVYIRRQHESDGEFWIRTLEYTIDRLYANDKKLAIENRGLKSENEVIPNLRFQRDLAKSAEQAALQKVEKASACNVKLTAELRDERAKRDDDRTKFCFLKQARQRLQCCYHPQQDPDPAPRPYGLGLPARYRQGVYRGGRAYVMWR